ncbi:hypothetical protein RRG08_033169 [Elysia crispata]|uniref:Rho guanine nucleotide exchange factor 26 n=1 Tax=Elysia crispata TaxID=231223 RepID=A0AAE1D680_9GAST|nr:hypothetical protein RRG08_033169 [Elysia crispata]
MLNPRSIPSQFHSHVSNDYPGIRFLSSTAPAMILRTINVMIDVQRTPDSFLQCEALVLPLELMNPASFVWQTEPSSVSTDGEQDTAESAKAPGRRLGVYSQMKNLKNLAFKKLKAKGGKKKAGKSTKTDYLSDSEEIVVHSDGEGGWQHNRADNPDSDDSGDSSGTDYEDVEPNHGDLDGEEDAVTEGADGEECPYADLEDLGLGRPGAGAARGGSGRGAGAGKNKTLTHKLKNIFYNKKAKAAKKSKPVVDSGVSADTDSEGDQVDGCEGPLGPGDSAPDLAGDAISRTSSERSSGRFVRDDTGSVSSASTAAASTYTLASAVGGSTGQPTTTTTTAAAAASATTASSSLAGDGRSKSSSSLSTTSAAATTQASSSSAPAPASSTSSSSTTTTTTTSSVPMSSSNMPPPPLPPRTSKNLSQPAENSPPLPPRNPSAPPKSSTLGMPLDTVVPVSPPGNRASTAGKHDKKKDRFSFGYDGSENNITAKLDYIDYDPASAQTLERIEKSERRSNASNRPMSSSSNTSSSGGGSNSNYMYPDLSAFPQLKGDNSDDNLYVDLITLTQRPNEDEHIYGKASDIYQSRFESEPLYQWYSKDKMIQNTRSDKSTSDDLSDEEYLELEEKSRPESVYEDVERLLEKTSLTVTRDKASMKSNSTSSSESISTPISAKDKPQRRSVIEDVFKNGGNLHRALWCQMPEVISSGLLEKLSDQEKKIQEAMFEIMTSEASYQRSLKVLISVFLMAPEFSADMSDRCVITRRDRQVLFSNIGHIKDISEDFLRDLEERWQESCHMKDVCDIIHKHASQKFEPYVRYCSNQAYQDRALNNLKQNAEFSEAVKRLEQNSQCQFLPLASFLLLPMQRITRLPLLVDAIAHRLEPGCALHTSCKKALDSLTKVAKRCDEAAKKMQQAEQMCLLASNLEFKVKEFPLVSASRFLVKQGELNMIKADGTNRKPLSKLLGSHKEHLYLYLFNDVLMVTKKKGSAFQVRDYCQRNSLYVEAVDNPDKSRHLAPGVATGVPNLLFLALLANHDNKQVELVLSCKSESERTRWVEAISPTSSAGDSERIYDYWDCPQFHCVQKYIAQQPDELTLEESDVINVTRKMADGWCEGERIRDGEKGWFPASHTEEINNSHVRARNLRMRYRLMMASQEYALMEFGNKH